MKVEEAVLSSPSLSPYGLCGRKASPNERGGLRAQKLCESRGGCPGLFVPNSPVRPLWTESKTKGIVSELRSSVKIEVAVLD